MRVRVITPPPPIVTWADADAHLRLDGDEEQRPYVESLIAAATGALDGPGGWLNRALGPQTLELRTDRFWTEAGELPYPELIDVLSVEYLDRNGVIQTLDPAAYQIEGRDLFPAFGTAWPDSRQGRGAVRITYVAGYVADPAASTLVPAVPPAIRAAILLMVGDLYRNRSTVTVGTIANQTPMSTTVENLVAGYRVFA